MFRRHKIDLFQGYPTFGAVWEGDLQVVDGWVASETTVGRDFVGSRPTNSTRIALEDGSTHLSSIDAPLPWWWSSTSNARTRDTTRLMYSYIRVGTLQCYKGWRICKRVILSRKPLIRILRFGQNNQIGEAHFCSCIIYTILFVFESFDTPKQGPKFKLTIQNCIYLLNPISSV